MNAPSVRHEAPQGLERLCRTMNTFEHVRVLSRRSGKLSVTVQWMLANPTGAVICGTEAQKQELLKRLRDWHSDRGREFNYNYWSQRIIQPKS